MFTKNPVKLQHWHTTHYTMIYLQRTCSAISASFSKRSFSATRCSSADSIMCVSFSCTAEMIVNTITMPKFSSPWTTEAQIYVFGAHEMFCSSSQITAEYTHATLPPAHVINWLSGNHANLCCRRYMSVYIHFYTFVFENEAKISSQTNNENKF